MMRLRAIDLRGLVWLGLWAVALVIWPYTPSGLLGLMGPTVAWAAAPEPVTAPTPATAPAPVAAPTPEADPHAIALLRFSGDPSGADLREEVKASLVATGVQVRSVALDLPAAATRIGCTGDPSREECLIGVGRWLAASPATAAGWIVTGHVEPGSPKRIEVTIFDVASGQKARILTASVGEADLILPIVLSGGIAEGIVRTTRGQLVPTPKEQEQLAELDEPSKTPEELAAEAEALAAAARVQPKTSVDGESAPIKVDLRADFKEFCRTGPPTKRTSPDDPKDLRPKCQRGPFWGYWQPRSFVATGLTLGLAVATIAYYSAALAARGPYRDAVDAVSDYEADVGGDPRRDPTFAESGDRRYDELATEVSRTGDVMQGRAIVGDVLLGASVAMLGVTSIIVRQDRRDAKAFIGQEKGLRAISTLRVVPAGRGLALRLQF